MSCKQKVSKTQPFRLDLLERKKRMKLYHQSEKKDDNGVSAEMVVSIERALEAQKLPNFHRRKSKIIGVGVLLSKETDHYK